MEHNFQIKNIRLIEAHFSLTKDFQWKPNEQIEIKHKVEVGYSSKETVLQVILSVDSMSENQPFRFSLSLEGSFIFEELPSKEDLDSVAHVNCAAMIFPFARESIADLTRRSGVPPFHLPPFNFLSRYEEKQKSHLEKTSTKPSQKGGKTKG